MAKIAAPTLVLGTWAGLHEQLKKYGIALSRADRFVDRVDAGVDDGYTVTLRGGVSVPVSRRQARQLREPLAL